MFRFFLSLWRYVVSDFSSLEFKTDTEKDVHLSGASAALQFKYIPVFIYKFT